MSIKLSLNKKTIFLKYVYILTCVISLSFSNIYATEISALDQPGNRCIVFIDYSLLSCSVCLHDFNEFCAYVNKNLTSVDIFGILVLEENGKVKEKVIKKQLYGFISANNITFPIYYRISNSALLLQENSDIMFLKNDQTVNWYKFSDFKSEEE